MEARPAISLPGKEAQLLAVLTSALALVMGLLGFQLWLSYQEQLRTAQSRTRDLAAIFEARLDATLRRVDADLAELAVGTPRAALSQGAVAQHAERLDALLDAKLKNFPEISGFRITDAAGNTLYSSNSRQTKRINISDRHYFIALKNDPALDLVFSDVVIGRSLGERAIGIARALRGPAGEFLGAVYGILRIEHLQTLFAPLDVGHHGFIALRRSDDRTLVMRQPPLPANAVEADPAAHLPFIESIEKGQRALTLDFLSTADGIERIVSLQALHHYPFYFVVGMAYRDILSGWVLRAQVVGVSALLCLLLLTWLAQSSWRARVREQQAIANVVAREALFRAMAEGVDQVFFYATANYDRFDYISPAFDRIWGHSGEQLMTTPDLWQQWVHEDDRERVRQFVAENWQRDSYALDFRIVRNDGGLRWISAHAFRLQAPDKSGMVVGFQTDISERKAFEDSIRENQERFRCLSEASSEAIFISEKGLCLEQNARAEALFGYSAEEALGRPGTDWIAPECREIARNNILSGYEGAYEVMALRKDGSRFPASIRGRMAHYRDRSVRITALTDITERKEAEAALRDSEAYNKLLFASSRIALAVLDPMSFRLIDCNQAAVELYGYPNRDALLAASAADVATPTQYDGRPSAELAPQMMQEALRKGSHAFEWRHRRPDGEIWDAEVHLTHFQHGGRTLLQFSLQDISARKRAEINLRIAATAFDVQEGMMITDGSERILRINRACSEITGYAADEVVGQTPRVFRSGRHDATFYRDMWATISTQGSWSGEICNRRKNGEEYPIWITISAVRNERSEITHYVASITDISQRKLAENEIRNLAFYDSLTGLPNRRLLLDRLGLALAASARSEGIGALLFIDLDNFKTLNDTRGHDKGDLLLRSVAQRLIANVREEDTVARLGGDEFVVMLQNLARDEREAAGLARQVGDKIRAALDHGHNLEGLPYECSASIGIALFSHPTDTVEDLLKRADLAMYQAKAAGRNTIRFFDPEMQMAAMARAVLEADLREAIRARQLLLYYQAQVDDDGHIFGAEALLRWRHPQRGMVSPAAFIPLAEESGLILPIGDWVLASACRQLRAWAELPHTAELSLSINISAKQIREVGFAERVLQHIAQSGANPRRLSLELTESMLVEDVEEIIAKMNRLKAAGIGFSLDDFGTGYSSLAYLKRLPLDVLKIDASFVRDVLVDVNDAAIARTVVALGKSLGLKVIAEGVETEAQRQFLATNGCTNYQGFLFSRPAPAEELERVILSRPGQAPHGT